MNTELIATRSGNGYDIFATNDFLTKEWLGVLIGTVGRRWDPNRQMWVQTVTDFHGTLNYAGCQMCVGGRRHEILSVALRDIRRFVERTDAAVRVERALLSVSAA